MAVAPFVSEGKCVSVEWDFLQGLLTKPPPLPCLQNLRKEKSRNAARSRRGKENFEFFELAKMLPLPGAITSQLDKASVIRLTISYLRMRDFASQGDPPWSPLLEGRPNNKVVGRSMSSLATDLFEQHLGGHLLQSLDGFVFVLSHEGRFLYISETVSIYLGLSQVELTGSSVFDYIHPADHVELADRLGMRSHLRGGAGSQAANESASSSASTSSLAETPEPVETPSPLPPDDDPPDRGFFVRMKSTLTKRGLHVKSSGYKVIHVTGRIRCRPVLAHGHSLSLQHALGLVALAHTLPPSTLSEVRMESNMFVFRVNMDLQVTYCENRISDYMDLSPGEVIGHSCYEFIHVQDVDTIRQGHEDLLRKGQVVTGYYRWLQRRGGFLWIQSCATISINNKTPHDRNVIWVNYVLSRPELPDTPLDIQQLPESLRPERVTLTPPDPPQHTKGTDTYKGPPLPHHQQLCDWRSPTAVITTASVHFILISMTSSYWVYTPGVSTSHKFKCGSDSGSKVRETYPPGSQSEVRRKKSRRRFSEEGPLETKRLQKGRDSESTASSEVESDSEGEGRVGYKRVKAEEEQRHETVSDVETDVEVGSERGKIQNGHPVIQHLKRATPPHIKTEPDFSTTSAGGGVLGHWGCSSAHIHSTLLSSLQGSGIHNGSCPPQLGVPDSALTPPGGEAPPKSLFTPSSPALSPPLSGSPLPREDRLLPGGDYELLHRLAAGGGGRVLLPLPPAAPGPQSLYAPSTIRYAPAELSPAQPDTPRLGLPQGSPTDPKPHSLFPHLQRISALPPFSGFSSPDSAFPPGLPFCISGLQGTTNKEED
ncbi:neuronal PAS domain-containing protein 1 [Amia ocellicauda]|uniref:neuronal PAS domain-containing protein 1 n=1 Tax=Amia ocellicauda TaxID=2972642 RepID=UPI0034640199